MLDFITSPFSWFANIVQYSLIFMAIVIIVLTIGAVVAIPIGLKLLGVAFAKTIVVETSKVLKDLSIDKIDAKQSQDIKMLKYHYDQKVVPILSRVKA
jgi:uncharacterized RDD family membrane protein YckC